jgi:hypothetical protein
MYYNSASSLGYVRVVSAHLSTRCTTHASDLQDGQDCHVSCPPPITVVASSVPRGHVIVVVQDAEVHVVPRGCGETRFTRYTMRLH